MKVGLLIPSVNEVAERDFHAMAPGGVEIHTNRVRQNIAKWLTEMEHTSKQFATLMETMSRNLEVAAAGVLDAGVQVICYTCNAAGYLMGMGSDRRLVSIIERSSKLPATTTSTAMLEALEAMKLRNIAVATPHIEQNNRALREFLEGNGYNVVAIRGLALPTASQIAQQEPETMYRLAKEVNSPKADGIYVSCANLHAIEVIEKLERDLGKPVLTANQVAFWATLRRIGFAKPIRGYGMLLETLS
jgi:maleate isomerase